MCSRNCFRRPAAGSGGGGRGTRTAPSTTTAGASAGMWRFYTDDSPGIKMWVIHSSCTNFQNESWTKNYCKFFMAFDVFRAKFFMMFVIYYVEFLWKKMIALCFMHIQCIQIWFTGLESLKESKCIGKSRQFLKIFYV